MQMIFKTSKFFFSYCIHVTSVNTDFFVCMCVWNNPYPPPFPPPHFSSHLHKVSQHYRSNASPFLCPSSLHFWLKTLCKRLLKQHTHTSSEMVPSPLQMWRRALTKRDGCILDFNVLFSFFLTLLSHYAVFLLNFGVRIHQGDKWNPFKKEKINQNWEAASHWRLVQKQKSCCEKGWQRMEGSDTATV